MGGKNTILRMNRQLSKINRKRYNELTTKRTEQQKPTAPSNPMLWVDITPWPPGSKGDDDLQMCEKHWLWCTDEDYDNTGMYVTTFICRNKECGFRISKSHGMAYYKNTGYPLSLKRFHIPKFCPKCGSININNMEV